MAYLYQNIEDFDPSIRPSYFFDANVWVAVLAGRSTKKETQYYIDFFEGVINLNLAKGLPLKILKRQKKYQPKIIMTSLLMSEIFNTYMRNIAMKQFYSSSEISSKKYKRDYRKTNDHATQLKRLKDDFLTYRDYFILLNDDFGNNITAQEVCNQLLSDADFNDFYYYYQLHGKDISIITDDGDFIFQDIEIITANSKLLKLVS